MAIYSINSQLLHPGQFPSPNGMAQSTPSNNISRSRSAVVILMTKLWSAFFTSVRRGSYSFSIFHDHPSGHTVTQLEPHAVRPALAKIYALQPAEKCGASSRIVIHSLGYTETQTEAMIAEGASAKAGAANVC
jgi:hypothetical protein